jgi:hypothetical protein
MRQGNCKGAWARMLSLILEALGETSVLFMSQDIKGTEMVMPIEELAEIGYNLHMKINTMLSRMGYIQTSLFEKKLHNE